MECPFGCPKDTHMLQSILYYCWKGVPLSVCLWFCNFVIFTFFIIYLYSTCHRNYVHIKISEIRWILRKLLAFVSILPSSQRILVLLRIDWRNGVFIIKMHMCVYSMKLVSIDSRNGMAPNGDMPFLGSMLTQI